jgi:hypothetical protein
MKYEQNRLQNWCWKAQYVVSTHVTKQLCINDSDNRDYIMSAECISDSEVSMTSFIILNEKLILNKWVNNDLSRSTKLAISDSDYSNDTLALVWLQHFKVQSCKSQKGKWCTLIINGYKSHLTWEFFQYALEHEIWLFQLSALYPLYAVTRRWLLSVIQVLSLRSSWQICITNWTYSE